MPKTGGSCGIGIQRSRKTTNKIVQIELLLREFAAISQFFPDSWISREIGKVQRSQSHHVFWDYLVSPYGYVFGKKANAMFEVVLNRAKSQVPRFRKKIIDANTQDLFESVWVELEMVCLLLRHGHAVQVEPLGRKQEGPDVKTRLSGYDVCIEAKKLSPHVEVVQMWQRILEVDTLLVRELKNLACHVDVYFTLTPQLSAPHKRHFIEEVILAAEKLATSNNPRQRVECKDSNGQILAEADVCLSDISTSNAFGGWIRDITANSRDRDNGKKKWNLEGRYLTGRQFPDDGLHILMVDTSDLDDGDTLMSQIWEQAICPSINCLVICHRQVNHRHRHWLNDLTVDPMFIQNSLVPLPDDVFDTLKHVFQ
jgi:hypothetical protein